MVNPVPVDRARALGADVVIAAQPIPPLEPDSVDPLAHLLGRASRLGELLPLHRLRQQLGLMSTTLRSFQALWFRLASGTALAADVCVRPDLRGFWFLQFGAATPLIEAGRLAGEAEYRPSGPRSWIAWGCRSRCRAERRRHDDRSAQPPGCSDAIGFTIGKRYVLWYSGIVVLVDAAGPRPRSCSRPGRMSCDASFRTTSPISWGPSTRRRSAPIGRSPSSALAA
jgi:hypothetical protein